MMLMASVCIAFAALVVVASVQYNCSSVWKAGHRFNISTIHYVKEEKERVYHYDEQSCFLMDARYNCKHSSPRNNSLLHWKPYLMNDAGQRCGVTELWDSVGGLPNLTKKIRSWSHRQGNVTHTNVLILGSSFLRQVYEALVCRYREHIVDGLVELNATHIGMAQMAERNGTFYPSDMGEMRPMLEYRTGCHGTNTPHFYPPAFVPPYSKHECSDSISMVEFPGGLRFYYVFRSYVYSSCVPELLQHLQLDGSHVDAVITNQVPPETAAVRKYLNPRVSVISAIYILELFRAVQTRDCGWWDGADNVGMHHVPDIHPCMPGIPDDELEVLLFALAHNLQKVK